VAATYRPCAVRHNLGGQVCVLPWVRTKSYVDPRANGIPPWATPQSTPRFESLILRAPNRPWAKALVFRSAADFGTNLGSVLSPSLSHFTPFLDTFAISVLHIASRLR
jgi:hypothetical protein